MTQRHPLSGWLRLINCKLKKLQVRLASSMTSLPVDNGALASFWMEFGLPSFSSPGIYARTHISFSVTTASDDVISSAVTLLTDLLEPKKMYIPAVTPTGELIARLVMTSLLITPHPMATALTSEKKSFVPRYTGHRGMGSSGPHAPWRPLENTPHSFLEAATSETQVNTVELDVQPTADGRVVVFHDWFFRPRDPSGQVMFDRDTVR